MNKLPRVPYNGNPIVVKRVYNNNNSRTIKLSTGNLLKTPIDCNLVKGTEVELFKNEDSVRVIASMPSICLKKCLSMNNCPYFAGEQAVDTSSKFPTFAEYILVPNNG